MRRTPRPAGGLRAVRAAAASALSLLVAAAAGALAIASGDGGGNTAPPPDDPGWRHVGWRAEGNVLPVVYVGGGWVITARHVGWGDVVLGGVTHPFRPGSERPLSNDDGSASEIVAFRLESEPSLPNLPIRARPPVPGDAVVIVGRGRRRTDPTVWLGLRGYALGTGGSMRWGTNVVERTGLSLPVGGVRTAGFSTRFSERGGTPHEAQATAGDSGGAVFIRSGAGWELAGLAHATRSYAGQPADVVLFGAETLFSDLSRYRAQIEALRAAPEPKTPGP